MRTRDIVAIILVAISLATLVACVVVVRDFKDGGAPNENQDVVQSDATEFIEVDADRPKISYDDYALCFRINGESFKLGLRGSELNEMLHFVGGAADVSHKTVYPQCTKNFDLFDKNGNKFVVGVYNDTDEAQPFENCTICRIDFDSTQLATASIKLFDGLDFNSSIGDFADAFGSWTNKTTNGDRNVYYWDIDEGEIYVIANGSTKAITSIQLMAKTN